MFTGSCSPRQLFYKTGRLRVVVSTANLIEYDWRDIENVSSTIDHPVPRLIAVLVRLGPRRSPTSLPHPTQLKSERLPDDDDARPALAERCAGARHLT